MLPLLHLEREREIDRERVERERGVTGAEETLIKEKGVNAKREKWETGRGGLYREYFREGKGISGLLS